MRKNNLQNELSALLITKGSYMRHNATRRALQESRFSCLNTQAEYFKKCKEEYVLRYGAVRIWIELDKGKREINGWWACWVPKKDKRQQSVADTVDV